MAEAIQLKRHEGETAQQLKVLCLEDEDFDAELVEETLRGSWPGQLEFQTVRCVREALEALSRASADLILADLHVPDGAGVEVVERLLERAPETPLVALSGCSDDRLTKELVRAGSQDFVAKSELSWPGLLARVVRFALDRHEQLVKRKGDTDRLATKAEHFEFLAFHDELTGSLNRRGLQRRIEVEAVRASRENTETSLVLVDLDRFKQINDGHGHEAGDEVLRRVSEQLRSVLRATDTVARLGGDEFLVLLPRTRSLEARVVAEKLKEAVQGASLEYRGHWVGVSASFGVMTLPLGKLALEEVFAKVDEALYESKRCGGNHITSLQETSRRCSRRVQRLTSPDSFTVLRQSVVRLLDREVVGYELLSRSCLEGLEEPEEFFIYAAQLERLGDVDLACLEACLRAAREAAEAGFYYINVFPQTLIERTDEVLSLLDSRPRAGICCLEVSQQHVIGDLRRLAEAFQRLRQSGCYVGLDDFAFGPRAYESLILLQPDMLKIDCGRLSGLDRGHLGRLLGSFQGAAERLGVSLIAERVGSWLELQRIAALGVRCGQGFLFGGPERLGNNVDGEAAAG